jgi:hypothetical protein
MDAREGMGQLTYALGGERLRGRDARVELGVLLGKGFGVGRHDVRCFLGGCDGLFLVST